MADFDSVFAEDVGDRRGDVLILVGQQLRAALDHRDRAAEAAHRLRKLEADVPAAEHDEPWGDALQVEQRLARQRGGLRPGPGSAGSPDERRC
jgi:hypothetical protein